MKWIVACVVGCCLQLPLQAAEGDYAINKINPALLQHADAVTRADYTRLDIKSEGAAVLYCKYAVTILNESGDRYAGIVEFYDKFHTIRYIEGTLYDGEGKKIRALKKADIGDYSTTGESFASDGRKKMFNFYYKTYPYTVEYEVEVKRDELMFMPSWKPQDDEHCSVENSVFEVTMPEAYQIRYKAYNYVAAPVITAIKDRKTYHWEVSGLPALKDEYAGTGAMSLAPRVLLGPTKFEIDDYKGEMDSWKSFGKFIYALKQHKDELPPTIKQAVHQLADPLKDEHDKIAALYHYLQQNTHYISIQLGIGGWQPLDATFVGTKGYGDCKALSNFMFALLKEAGITSYYTMIRAGEYARPIVEDFPSQQFNHVILCVPLQKDTVWLECTSQILPAGYLGNFTCNRTALLVKESGGYLVRTPRYSMNDNLQSRTIKATLKDNGDLISTVATTYGGLQQDDLFMLIHQLPKNKQLEQLKKSMSLGTFDIPSLDYAALPGAVPALKEDMQLTVNSYAQVTGKRLFLVPNMLNRSSVKLKEEERLQDIEIAYEYVDVDSVEVAVPAGYAVELQPKDVQLQSKFGRYSINFKFNDDKIMMYRRVERVSGTFPKTDYKEMVQFYDEIYKADRSKMVLVRKD